MRGRSKTDNKTLNAKLFVRILPTMDICHDSIKVEANKRVMYVRCLQDLTKGVTEKNPNFWSFCTDGVLWNASQAEAYETIVSDWFEDVFDGVGGIILSYGQTGSGKTFTTSGLRFQYQNRGLILRILTRLLEEEERKRDVTKISFGMTYLEFMGETVRDLLTNRIVEKIKEVPEHLVESEEWAWRQIFNGECRKSYSEDAPYKGSNRGHSVLTFYVHSESLVDTDPIVTHSKIHVVDMAGIDNLGSRASSWKDKSDLGQSNLSKCLMEQLIICLTGGTWKSEGHICPYKSSRFLTYLHDTLRPECLLRFVAHVYGNQMNLPLTVSTLKFGEKLRALKPCRLERIVESNCILRMRNLERECLRLQEEAEAREMLRDAPDYCNLSQEKVLQIKRAAEGFLLGELENLTLFSFGQASITLDTFRELYRRLSEEKDQMIKEAISAAAEILQSQYATERNSVLSSPVLPNAQRTSRRKSRQQESQLTFGGSYRSSDSGQNNLGRVSSVVQQAGVGDRRGIGLGPGKMSGSFEGNVAKALKKLKSRRSDSTIMKAGKPLAAKEVGVSVARSQMAEDLTEFPLPQLVPSREAAWQNFCQEDPESVNDMLKNVENCEEAARVSRKKYVAALTELAQLRAEVEELKSELTNCQHIRYICSREEFDEDGNPVPGETEKELRESLAQKEEKLNACIENCHVALIDFKSFTEELNGAKKNLDEAFQDYCKLNYKIVLLPEEMNAREQNSISVSSTGRDSICEFDSRLQALMDLYSHLQQKLFNYVPKSKKKEWKNY